MKKILPFLFCVTLSFSAFADFENGVYSFDELKAGDLDGQDGWTATRMYSKDGVLQVVPTSDGEKVVTGTPGKTRYYYRMLKPGDVKNAGEISLDKLTLQFDIEAGPHSGTFFFGGEGVGVAVIWDEMLRVRANGISGKMPLLAEMPQPDVADGTWITLRCEIEGDSAKLSWKKAEEEGADFTELSGGERFPVGDLLMSRDSWDRIGVAIGQSGTMRVDNLVPDLEATRITISDQ